MDKHHFPSRIANKRKVFVILKNRKPNKPIKNLTIDTKGCNV
jgi:hypothetical protein